MIGSEQLGFTHLESGTPECDWLDAGVARLSALETEPATSLFGPGTLLLVGAAHPDDECLGAGGLIVTALAAGADVTVLLCTLGEGSHPDSPTTPGDRLAALRDGEFQAAMRELGDSAAEIARASGRASGRLVSAQLRLPDGQLSGELPKIEEAAATHLRGARASRVVVAAPYRRDGHTDHEAVGEALARVALDMGATLLEFPIWFWHWAKPNLDQEWRHWMRVPLAEGASRSKSAALAAHASQVQPLSSAKGDEAVLGASTLEHFSRDFEVFRVTAPGTSDAGLASRAFDGVHEGADDPWALRESWYERRKLALLLAMLPSARSRFALEFGCSIGESTAALADRCDRLIAVDASATALGRAHARLAGRRNVELVHATLPRDWDRIALGEHPLDLVVISETGYYLAEDELCELVAKVRRALSPDGFLVLCHWRGPIRGWPLDGDTVHHLVSLLGMRSIACYQQAETLIDVYENGNPAAGPSCFVDLGATAAKRAVDESPESGEPA